MGWVKIPFKVSIFILATFLACGAALGQISPAEITKPDLKKAEQTYFQQLIDLNRAITATKFPFPLVLSRYPGLDPKEQLGADKRGLEFVKFEGRVVLKISGNYNAAFNAHGLTENRRAGRVMEEVIEPILQLLPKYFSRQSNFEGVGFEISYHVRTDKPSYSYEGREILTVVLNTAEAFKYAGASDVSARQDILDDSVVYVDGKRFGLMLGQRDSSEVEDTSIANPAAAPVAQSEGSTVKPSARVPSPEPEPPGSSGLAAPKVAASTSPAIPDTRAILTGQAPATQADADALQSKLQSRLDALNAEGRAHDAFVDYAPPSFAVFRDRIYLQLTLRNPAAFDPNATSIYKRAARSFDIFLAPKLKGLLAKTPHDSAIAGLDITVLTEFSSNSSSSSEAIEYLFPIAPLRQFTDADITNQDLIDQSVVLVNGVRIALDLQKVE